MARAGRPVTNTAEYFPHFVKEGKTIFILESKFGNDGWAFWFKLLSLLSGSEGHYYDFNSKSAWEFLLAKMKVDAGTGQEILQSLDELEDLN